MENEIFLDVNGNEVNIGDICVVSYGGYVRNQVLIDVCSVTLHFSNIYNGQKINIKYPSWSVRYVRKELCKNMVYKLEHVPFDFWQPIKK